MIEILIADDHPIIREGIRSILKNQPGIFIKKEVDNGIDVLKELRSEKYDILLLDISLTKKNGLEVLEEIKKRNYDIKVIILSIHTEREYIVRSFGLGALGYLSKEAFGNELIKAIRNVHMGKKYVPLNIAEELANFFECKDYPQRKLSNREYQVLVMIASGKSIKEIADNLNLSEKTISTYRNRLLKKLNLKNNAEIIYYSIKNKLINI
jgi:DNA-binding NarL/FixJ family response regulator